MGKMLALPPEPKILRYMHLEKVVDQFPQTDGDCVNYTIAGGGASMLLLEAAEVRDREVVDPEADNRRKHKDLELVAFRPVFGEVNPNPHDVGYLTDEDTLCRCDYEEEPPSDYELMVEVLSGFYYDFQLPTVADTTEIETRQGNRFVTLTPEFIIASKLFSANGIRPGTDDKDALALFRRFTINQDYLRSLLSRSEFSPVAGEIDTENLGESVESGDLYDRTSKKIDELYGEAVPEVVALPYSDKISVLRYGVDDLALDDSQREFIDEYVEEQKPLSRYSHFKEFYRLCLRYMVSPLKMGAPDVGWPMDKFADMARRDQHLAISVASAMKQTLDALGRIEGIEQETGLYHVLATELGIKILTTYYMHVATSLLRERLSNVSNASELDYRELVKGI